MIVHNLDIIGMSLAPSEADSPSVIDANAMLAGTVDFQRFEPVAADSAQVVKISCCMEPTKLFPGSLLDALKFPAAETVV
jgi:hypothetical protein